MEELIELFEIQQGMNLVISLIQIALAVFTIIVMWKVYDKAGEGGWKIFIPIYNIYIQYKIAGCKGRYWVSLLLSIISMGLMVYSAGDILNDLYLVGTIAYLPDSTIICVLAAFALLLIVAIIGITVPFKMAKAFGCSGLFGLGLWLLPTIFYAIIAFNDNIFHRFPKRRTMV